MKLEKIKLSGFKSFVDPTVIPIKGNLTAIVGPNGCGKSNIIDAVRWVMGESSAKHLRGGSMADVIFNGSSGRKPVNTATVELIFDNTEGKLGGEYAQYDTIALKRQVSRDGQSLFLLNGARCRRKDITDLFLGTGLGSRSYAIIEQGTISRMVEAKPDELRVHIEEAAGISKYKERRQETEMRMKHTRENLERLDDLRDEVDKQLKHLQKQAEKAEKYTELKQQERQLKLELLAMRWQAHQQTAQQLDAKLQAVATEHNRLFVLLRELDNQLDHKRAEHKQQQQQLNRTQGDYYTVVADVTRLEQTIKHTENSRQETALDISRHRQQVAQLAEDLAADNQALEDIKQALFEAEESIQVAEERQDSAQQHQQDVLQQQRLWQQQWDAYQATTAQYTAQADVQRVKTTQLDNQNRQLQNRVAKLQHERDHLTATDLQSAIDTLAETIELIEEQREQSQHELATLQQSIVRQRQQVKHYHDQLHARRSENQTIKGKLTSLELLQQHALGKDNQQLSAWLTVVNLTDKPRLAEFLEVQTGWETAVETVLNHALQAICVDNIASVMPHLASLTDESLSLFAINSDNNSAQPPTTLPRLCDKITAPWSLSGLLTGVYCAETSAIAYTLSAELQPDESIITPDGTWFGLDWLTINRSKDSKAGMLQREKMVRVLKQQHETLHYDIAVLEEQLDLTETELKQAETQREALQQQVNRLGAELSLKNAEFSAQSARFEQQQQRLQHVLTDLDDMSHELADNAEQRSLAELLFDEAQQQIAAQAELRQQLDSLNQTLQTQAYQAERAVNDVRQQVYALKSTIDGFRAAAIATTKQIERLHTQQQQGLERIADLDHKLQQSLLPLDDEKQQLEHYSANKQQLETTLKQQRQLQQAIEAMLTELAEQHAHTQRGLASQKDSLDNLRFEAQETKVRQQTVTEQLHEVSADIAQVLANLPAHAEETTWKLKADELVVQIERLGTINLTAIEDYKAQSERMSFLNEQQADLTEALQLLDQAISKIDKESRLRFKATFDKINSGLQEKFPKLFGGGQAYLELTDPTVVESGVNIIARPPGKRNSSIHLLSGGEKALTAVALVFSIFELNPAPFCLLDEVDAPLDDANVGRFSKMVEEMSASVQFLYISHNKVTMEIAKQLAGVTMKEPGVSRMVSVDIEEAMSLAEI